MMEGVCPRSPSLALQFEGFSPRGKLEVLGYIFHNGEGVHQVFTIKGVFYLAI